ncbi:MAG: hypothetical protein ACYTXL_34680 [Nostoc sp.]
MAGWRGNDETILDQYQPQVDSGARCLRNCQNICGIMLLQYLYNGNAAMNIRAEGIRMLSSSGTGEANASGEDVRPIRGRKSKMRQSSVKLEAHTLPSGQCG